MIRRAAGYTLLEVCAVLSIAALLVAIVFAVSAPLRERARQSRCIHNLKQIGAALQMYRQDWDGIDPIGNGLPLPYHRLGLPEGSLWTKALPLPRSVWFCPSRWCDPYYEASYERHASSYMFLALSDREVDNLNRDPDTLATYRPLGEILAENPNFPLLVCVFHDRYRQTVSEERLKFHTEGRVLGLSLWGEVRWYEYKSLWSLRKRHRER
ncbi:MAG: hypothetical protein KatS3mg019_1532 [Fimbriimonadales bacterium]|nr:MAG: hypothetical protein KatS3mg019_1532 [Fimbriimonadales bacterium]